MIEVVLDQRERLGLGGVTVVGRGEKRRDRRRGSDGAEDDTGVGTGDGTTAAGAPTRVGLGGGATGAVRDSAFTPEP